MKRCHLPKRRTGLHLNMTPMIDVVFLLIIFFMTVAEFSRIETEEVELPVADEAAVEESVPPGRVVINVDKDGRLVVSKQQVDFSTLQGWLRGEAQQHRIGKGEINLQVLVRSDGRADFGRIQDIMLECARNGIWQISFAALKNRAPGDAETGGL
ncbi:MAG: biopolymer transporter ExbD [Planctomycetes bacterium]|nr:biopolymer transporter ExbD [Planctomycetota bacterium]